MKNLFLILIVIAFGVSCKKEEKPFNESFELKTSLQGTWKRVINTPPSSILFNEVIFDNNSISWYDSTVNIDNNMNGEIQTLRGQCPVKFTFRDGIQYYNPDNTTYVYSFSSSTESNLLWVFIQDGEQSKIVDYKVTDGNISPGVSWQTQSIAGYVSTCTVRLSDDKKTVQFCDPGGQYCNTFMKLN